MKKITLIASLLTTVLVTQNAMASEEVIEQENKELLTEKKLSVSERISIKLEEKKRLRSTAERRAYKDSNDLVSFYIDELKHEDKVKALLREAAFYFDFLLENHNNYDEIEKESVNIGFNSICLAANLSENEFFIVYESISSLKVESESDKQKFAEANYNLMKSFQNNPQPPHTQEEINIRCREVYK